MTDTDWGGLIGTVVMGGVAIKMTEKLFGESKPLSTSKKKKTNKKNSINYPKFNNPLV